MKKKLYNLIFLWILFFMTVALCTSRATTTEHNNYDNDIRIALVRGSGTGK